MTSVASQAEDADSIRAPGLTSGLQGSVNVHRGALLLVPRWQRIGSYVFYIEKKHILIMLHVINPINKKKTKLSTFHFEWRDKNRFASPLGVAVGLLSI